MSVGAQLSVTDMRRAARHPIDIRVIGEHWRAGDIPLHIVNISAQGFMAQGSVSMSRGERVTVRLPKVGRIEAHLIWIAEDRAGFQFERIIRPDDFFALVDEVQPNPRLRRTR